MTLLPPNATALERALEAGTARLGGVDAPIAALADPATIAPELLPWLAWGLSVDSWDADWTDAAKRDAVATSIATHRRKGTRVSVEALLARFDILIELVEWHQQTPRAAPHTFEVRLPIASELAQPGGRRATAAFAEAIIREVARVKPLREHFTLLQTLAARIVLGVQGVARAALVRRDPLTFTDDRSQPWEALLQTEDGEPLQGDDGAFLDATP